MASRFRSQRSGITFKIIGFEETERRKRKHRQMLLAFMQCRPSGLRARRINLVCDHEQARERLFMSHGHPHVR